jgi:hypothetical protein
MNYPTTEQLNKLLDYNHENGIFTWKKREGSGRSVNVFNALYAGKLAGNIHRTVKSKTAYIAIKINGKTYKAHRLAYVAMGINLPKEVDHIDHDGTNNAWSNLRSSDSFDNSKNLPMQKSNKSGAVGVNWHKSAKKWQARAVNGEGVRVDLGRFDKIEDAIKARNDAEKEFLYYEYRDNSNV